MITFFRRIRLRLLGQSSTDTVRKGVLDSGQVRKYMLYTLGEVALVVIGILIALQINNWNENRNEKKQIKKYFIGLIEALNDDLEYLNYTIEGNTFRADCIKQLLSWTNGASFDHIPKVLYEVDNNWDHKQLKVGWTNMWMDSMPDDYERPFVEECFKRTSYGNIIVSNQSTLEEFKNTGLFSNIHDEELKKDINFYYSLMNWHFSIWRESNYRQKIDEWENFLRDNYQTNVRDISDIDDPIQFIKNNRNVQLELEDLAIDAASRVNAAGIIREGAKDLIQSINYHIQKK